jgi:hypothetical protein
MEVLWRGPQLSVSPNYIGKEVIGIDFHLKCILKKPMYFILYDAVKQSTHMILYVCVL